MDENIESLQNLEENLKEHGLSLDTIPWVIQYNKRDLPDVYSIDELERALNPRKVPSFEASAKSGDGVIESFKTVSRMLLKHLSQQIGVKIVSQSEERRQRRDRSRPVASRRPRNRRKLRSRTCHNAPAAAPTAPGPQPVASGPYGCRRSQRSFGAGAGGRRGPARVGVEGTAISR